MDTKRRDTIRRYIIEKIRYRTEQLKASRNINNTHILHELYTSDNMHWMSIELLMDSSTERPRGVSIYKKYDDPFGITHSDDFMIAQRQIILWSYPNPNTTRMKWITKTLHSELGERNRESYHAVELEYDMQGELVGYQDYKGNHWQAHWDIPNPFPIRVNPEDVDKYIEELLGVWKYHGNIEYQADDSNWGRHFNYREMRASLKSYGDFNSDIDA